MTTNKAAPIYISLAIALALGATLVQAQTADTNTLSPVQADADYVADPAVQEQAIEEQQQVLETVVEEQEAQVAVEEAEQEADLALEQQEDEAAHDTEMNGAVSDHDAEMRAFLKSQGLPAPK